MANLTSPTTFRLYGYSATATGGTGGFDAGSNIVNVQLNGTTAAISLPVTLLRFSGYKDHSRNLLEWTTSTEINNHGFEVERSTDGVNYSAIGFVNSKAFGGNSVDELNYSFTDNNPTGNKQYYRLRQVDLDNQGRMSQIVLIRGSKPGSLLIDGLFPNPANSQVNILIVAPARSKETLNISDMSGRIVQQQTVNVETGSNTIRVDISNLGSGAYLVRMGCKDGCEGRPVKFIKQ